MRPLGPLRCCEHTLASPPPLLLRIKTLALLHRAPTTKQKKPLEKSSGLWFVGAKGFELMQCVHCEVELIPYRADHWSSNKHTSIGSTTTTFELAMLTPQVVCTAEWWQRSCAKELWRWDVSHHHRHYYFASRHLHQYTVHPPQNKKTT